MVLDKFKLDNKIALVTGANRGIGQMLAVALAEAGADIVAVSRQGDFNDTKNLISDLGRKIKTYNADFSDRHSVYKLIKNVQADFARVDILVNNAGTILRTPICEHPNEY